MPLFVPTSPPDLTNTTGLISDAMESFVNLASTSVTIVVGIVAVHFTGSIWLERLLASGVALDIMTHSAGQRPVAAPPLGMEARAVQRVEPAA